jgi:pimeloyl-ACP methyl ester carboxylesterase
MFYRLLYLLMFSFLCSSVVAQQYYQKGYRSVTYIDLSRSGRSITTDLYYPANSAGTNVPIASGNTRFPVVVFGHGFSLPPSAYVKLADTLTRYGYIAAFPGTETGLSPSHDNFGKDLSYLCTTIIQSDADPSSFLYQRLIPKAAVGGHSMGGGCSFLAAATGNSNIFALFNMAAAETNPSAIAAAGLINVPTLQFSGSNDCIVPPATQQSMYNNILSSCKSQVTITGATHCQIADNNFTCSFGQVSSGCNSSPITVATVYSKTTDLLIPFLDYTLNGVCTSGVDFVSKLSTTTGISAVSNCPVPNCSILPVRIKNFSVQNQKDKAKIHFETENTSGNPYRIMIEKSSNGNNFQEWRIFDQQSADYLFAENITDSFPFSPVSYYRLKLQTNNSAFFSDILSMKKLPAFEFTLPFGNLVVDRLKIRLKSINESPVMIRIMGSDGRVYFEEKYTSFNADQIIQLPMSLFSAGVYFAEARSLTANYTERIRFVKLN